MNNEASVFNVVAYLCRNGHSDIGLVKSSIETRNFCLRERAFKESLELQGLDASKIQVFAIDSTFEQGFLDMRQQLRGLTHLPSALFCVNDVIAYSCKKALDECGFRVPDTVSLVGFDDLPSNVYMNPPLSSVKVSKASIGTRAMQLLVQRIQNPHRPSEKILISGELVERGSVCKRQKNNGGFT